MRQNTCNMVSDRKSTTEYEIFIFLSFSVLRPLHTNTRSSHLKVKRSTSILLDFVECEVDSNVFLGGKSLLYIIN